MKFGGDYLGGKRFEKAMIAAHPVGWVGGIFLRTFGDSLTTVQEMAASGKFSEIASHLAPFDRTHRYPVNDLKRQLMRDARWLNALSKRYPQIVFLLSPFCEHNHPAKVMAPLFKDLKKVAPTCLMLNSIWKGQEVPDTITEIHLENSKHLPKRPRNPDYTVSFDGFGGDGSGNFTDTNIAAILNRYSDARHIRWWDFRCNGKFGHKDTAGVDSRTHWPSVEYLKTRHAMMKNREGALTWSKNDLLKPAAEDHGDPAPTKDNKFMVITKVKKPALDVFDCNGKKIDALKRYLPDNELGARYYSSKYSYQIGDIAQKNTGSRLIRVDKLPLTDADLRSGLFR